MTENTEIAQGQAASKKVRVVLIGGSGYTGFEVVKILARHPQAELVGVFGPAGRAGAHGELLPAPQQALQPQPGAVRAGPAGRSRRRPGHALRAPQGGHGLRARPAGRRPAGHRLVGRLPHSRRGRLREMVLPSTPTRTTSPRRSTACRSTTPTPSATARLIANPGCYPTCTALALAPILKAGLIEPTGIIVERHQRRVRARVASPPRSSTSPTATRTSSPTASATTATCRRSSRPSPT